MHKRRISKHLYLTAIISVIGLFLFSAWSEREYSSVYADQIRKITLQRLYLDGEMGEETIVKEVGSVSEIKEVYKDWELVLQNDKELVFQKKINDISPLLKANGYFGITEDGTLSIFNGKPIHSDVIQSFFQIDVEMLETKKHNELVEGIPVKDKKHYESVLEVFEQYME
ncbi:MULTISPECIES: BofC C-terminal domain-containing protein [Bacillus]|uniref:BofC C-terminal domain-containing protein n=1 Tax=Bacillus TaxID=1386 RepID=UPI0002E5C425|nr:MULTISPECIES: BofC C-terminal domain-containing protein [Bacillus]